MLYFSSTSTNKIYICVFKFLLYLLLIFKSLFVYIFLTIYKPKFFNFENLQ